MGDVNGQDLLAVDWTSICRRIVGEQRRLFDAHPDRADRGRYEGTVGKGGDRTLVLDRQCEDIVFAELDRLAASTDTGFVAISEERGRVEFNGGGPGRVVVDPIDGSLNVRRGIPQHSLSLAVATGDSMATVRFGFVFDFGANQEFLATAGAGAVLDGRPLKVEPAGQLEVVGIESAQPARMDHPMGQLAGDVYRLRCLGSLALTLSFVAAGRFDGMFSLQSSRTVDVAAAQLIAREAGILVSLGGRPLEEIGLGLDERFPVAAATTAEHLAIVAGAIPPA